MLLCTVVAPISQPDAIEPQRVGDHGHRAQRHRESLPEKADGHLTLFGPSPRRFLCSTPHRRIALALPKCSQGVMVNRILRRSARPQLQRHAASSHPTEGFNMNRPVLTPPPKVKTLAQQKSDFTAEGAPPPGKVGMANPDTAHECVETVSRAPTSVVSAHKRPPSGKNG
jgi:hypothetical protein